MAAFTPDIAEDLVLACRASADEILGAMARAFDGEFAGATVHDPAAYDPESPPDGFDGGGLAVVFRCGDSAAVAVLPEASGMLPPWYVAPDATGKSRLSTLAQELSMLLLPASHVADEYHIVPLESVAAALGRAELSAGATHVSITIQQEANEGRWSVLWPVGKHAELLPQQAAAAAAPAKPVPPPLEQAEEEWDDLARLPKYCRSFLKVQVPVAVNLASQKHTVQEIRELVPGAIIKFDKSCEEMLDLVVCDQPIAMGEVVKVGDKFGLRIRNMILPQEQFIAIKGTMAS
ncbi:MAG: FliM/FliN family flagellar motor switch protein [Pirellulales bacterium]